MGHRSELGGISCLQALVFSLGADLQVSPQEASLVSSSRVENMGESRTFWYIMMHPGDRCPMEPSHVGAESSDRASESGSEVGFLLVFPLGGMVYEVVSTEGGSLGDSQGLSFLLSKFTR